MTTYLVARFDIIDENRYDDYGRRALPIVLKHSGTVIAADRAARTLEGSQPDMVLVIAFPDQAHAMAFYGDPDYQPLKAIRHAATTSHSLVLASSL